MLKKNKFQKGIALLLTLSILSLTLLLITNTVEDTSLELKLEDNLRKNFYIRRAEIASLRIFIAGLTSIGPDQIYYYLYQLPAQIPVPFTTGANSVAMSDISIKSIDHYFYINRINFNFRGEYITTQIELFKNILTQYNLKQQISEVDINSFIGELGDFVDNDVKVTTENLLTGREEYFNSLPRYYTKNSKLDSLTELILLPSFSKLNLLEDGQTFFDLPFRLVEHRNSNKICDVGPLNLNMIPPDKEKAKEILTKFINWSAGVSSQACGYESLYQNRYSIIDSISSFVDEKPNPPYSSPITQDFQWDKQTSLLGIAQAKTSLEGLFTSRPILVEIRFSLLIKQIKKDYILHLKLNYPNEKVVVPNLVTIIYFSKLN